MSFWKGLKRAFSFGHDADEDEDYNPSAPEYAANVRIEGQPTQQSDIGVRPQKENAPAAVVPTHDESLAGDIFDAIIEKFNASQPEFVKSCLNVDAQRAYLLNSLDQSLRRRLASQTPATTDPANDAELESLRDRVARLESEAKESDRENSRLRLSLDRQKRALLDRINDLEAQNKRHAEEREKLFADKNALTDAARLHASNAKIVELEGEISRLSESNSQLEDTVARHASELSARTTEIKTLRNQLGEARAESENRPEVNPDLEVEISLLNGEVSRLQQLLSDNTSQLEQQKTQAEAAASESRSQIDLLERRLHDSAEECTSLQASLAEAKTELARQNQMREQLEMKTAMGDEMLNSLRNSAAHSRQEAERLTAEVEALTSELETLRNLPAPTPDNNETEALNAQIEALNAKIEQLTSDGLELVAEVERLQAREEEITQEYERLASEQEASMTEILEQVREYKRGKDLLKERVAELENTLQSSHIEDRQEREQREQLIAKLNEDNASLRHTIESNLYSHANSEMKLRSEVKRLQAELDEIKSAAATPAAAEQKAPDYLSYAAAANSADTPPAPRKRGRPRKAKIDSDLNNVDWFNTQGKADSDFGYQEPPRRPSNDNEAQLSLF